MHEKKRKKTNKNTKVSLDNLEQQITQRPKRTLSQIIQIKLKANGRNTSRLNSFKYFTNTMLEFLYDILIFPYNILVISYHNLIMNLVTCG